MIEGCHSRSVKCGRENLATGNLCVAFAGVSRGSTALQHLLRGQIFGFEGGRNA